VVVELLEAGITVIVPIIDNKDGVDVLSHSRHRSEVELTPGRYGIPEPAVRSDVELNNIEAVILPLAAFDRKVNRLGYGKGFYDRFLAEFERPIRKIGLAFAVQEVPIIPAMEHDVPLDVIITEREVISITEDRSN
jgi:5-formyltetrahydrofolate cyclo-ligase